MLTKDFLYEINGEKNGGLKYFLDTFKGDPRIAWYPSAGDDFRDLLYLHPKFAEIAPATKPDPPLPDIFLHTDYYFPGSESTFRDNQIIHDDGSTRISIEIIEELSRLDFRLDSQIVDFPQGSSTTGRVIFLQIKVCSNRLGEFSRPLIYAFVENEAFCASKVLPAHCQFSHVIHVRYGGGHGGGGKARGGWLLNVLDRLGCEVFVTDGSHELSLGDRDALRLYPILEGSNTDREVIRTLESEKWSDYGDVTWNIPRDRSGNNMAPAREEEWR
ncbi:MAG: hypothetical protein Q8P24_16510 [Desulfobacterales bacterium]|nr:hypothetical protein [Desulfobacterales bacterium]